MSTNQIDRPVSLQESLQPFRWRAWRNIVAQSLLWCIIISVVALLLAMWLDTIVALPSIVRWSITRPGISFAILFAVAVIGVRLLQLTGEALAKRIDQVGETGGQVLSGLQLQEGTVQPKGQLTDALAKLATASSARVANQVSPSLAFGLEHLRRPAVWLSALLFGSFGIFLILPSISRHQIDRFLYPSEDIPPYTGMRIELNPESTEVLYGRDLLVKATIVQESQRLADSDVVTLVTLSESGEEVLLPMLRSDDNEWQTLLSRMTETVEIYARSGKSVSKKQKIEIILTPQILSPQVEITPPEYTRRPVYSGEIPDKKLSGLPGTLVSIDVPSNRPLQSGRMLLKMQNGDSETIPLAAKQDEIGQATMVSGSFSIERSGQFEIWIEDVDGIESHQPYEGTITVTSDQRPLVRITQPRPVSLATPDVTLPVIVSAEDDYGISSLELFRSLNGSPASSIATEPGLNNRMQWQTKLPLHRYHLEAGDEIKLFARVEDNDPSGAKGAESPVTIIKIISVKDYQEMMLRKHGVQAIEAKYQQARRHMEQISKALREVQEAQADLEKNPGSEEAAKKLEEKIAEAAKIAKQSSEAIEELSKQSMPVDIDKELAKNLKELSSLAKKMSEQLESMQAPGAGGQKPLSEKEKELIQEMLKKSGQSQKDLQDKSISPLRDMQKMMPLVAAEQRFVQLAKQQRDLSMRLNALKSSNDGSEQHQRRIAELEAEQQQLKNSLADLLDDIEAAAQEIDSADEELLKMKESAFEFVEAVRASDASQEMGLAQEKLLNDEMADAQASAEKAADILESFIKQCSGMSGQACKNCERKFQPSGCSMGDSIAQMMSMMGMKPGMSGLNPGGKPGFGTGWGRGGGYAQRFPGPQNMGVYGATPLAIPSQSSGRGESAAGSGQTSSIRTPGELGGERAEDLAQEGNAAGQSANQIPAQYRSQVAEYYRSLTEALGEVDNGEEE